MWVVFRLGEEDDQEQEAFGPFSSERAAWRFREAWQEHVQPGYGYAVAEMRGVNGAKREISWEIANGER